MRYLKKLKVNNEMNEDWLVKATSSKKAKVDELKEIEDELKRVYKSYDRIIINHKNKIKKSKFLTASDALKDFYNHPPKRLKKLIQERRTDHGLNECPFCGKPTAPSTLDHYVPKSDWPEFSIFQNNLVPQCKECAPIKGDSYYCDEKGLAIFISPLYSDILSKVCFHIDVEYSKDCNVININPRFFLSGDIDKEEEFRLKMHFESLKIKERIERYSYRRIRHWKNLLKENRFDIAEVLQTRIKERTLDERDKNWETSLYIGILENQELVDYLNSLCPENELPIKKEKLKKREMVL